MATEETTVNAGGWEEVNLFTRDGGFVLSATIPKFNPKAEALIWGSRIFIWSAEQERYVEGMAFYILPEYENRIQDGEAGK